MIIVLTSATPSSILPIMKRIIFNRISIGVRKVKKLVINIPTPKTLTPPYLLDNKPPSGLKKYPHENELKIIPLLTEDHLNSGS